MTCLADQSVKINLGLIIIFLALAAQFESFRDPIIILVSVPMSIAGALIFISLGLGGATLNIYTEVGLVTLMGLVSKHGILIVEFAKMGVDEGKSVLDATLEAARLRLRPILMTALAFILGCVPLAIASGAGSLSRRIMGFAVIGGMTAATVIAIFLIPVSFYVVQKWSDKRESTVPVKDKQEHDHE